MSVNASSDGASLEPDKPVETTDDVKFPPLPAPGDDDFDEDVGEEEREFYKSSFPDLNRVVQLKLHCTACDRHLGCSAKNETRMRTHPMLKTLICHACHSFYNSGEFDKGEDGSELYCRWCGQGGQVYCCSDCIHVFCAKCIKRNFGMSKIKEIENTDDWKCFKCNPKCLWGMRAICWALLLYCDFRNKIVAKTEDPRLKILYQKQIAVDQTECCRNKGRKKDKTDSVKKKEKESDSAAKKIISKIPPTIQVKKFASINLDETSKSIEKKAVKRSASPKNKGLNIPYLQKPISIPPCNIISPPPLIKKIRLPNPPQVMTPYRFLNEKKVGNTYTRLPSRAPRPLYPIPIANSSFNGFNNTPIFNNTNPMPNIIGDNINLSIETLTQGLDFSNISAYNNNSSLDNDNVVCTPDFPLEPLCEVTEDNDDDVECITPAPAVTPKTNNTAAVSRAISDLKVDNIVQMTENDVTVNPETGGLKFRVDPQTLSSKKMYRLPDGRIFAINPNPSMPGGYSATIVSVTEMGGKVAPKAGETYAAKLSSLPPVSKPSNNAKTIRNSVPRKPQNKSSGRSKGHSTSQTKETSRKVRNFDYKTPVEWYRYNLIDAVDALEYSLSRLNKIKKEATTAYLRTRTIDEVKYLHRTLEQALSTSSKRFIEIRDNLTREFKQFLSAKANPNKDEISEDDDDDDDVEILPNQTEDPIFIDENSNDSLENTQEVDLTGAASSEHNDSIENKDNSDPLAETNDTSVNKKIDVPGDTCSNKELSDVKDTENTDICNNEDDELAENTAKTGCLDDGNEENENVTDKINKSNSESDAQKVSESDCNNKDKNSGSVCDIDKESDIGSSSGIQHDINKSPCKDATSDEECNKSADKEVDEENSFDKKSNTDKKPDVDADTKSDEGDDFEKSRCNSETNGECKGQLLNDDESMEVDNEQSNLKENEDITQDTDMMNAELIDSLLQDDTLESVENVLNTSNLDISDDFVCKD